MCDILFQNNWYFHSGNFRILGCVDICYVCTRNIFFCSNKYVHAHMYVYTYKVCACTYVRIYDFHHHFSHHLCNRRITKTNNQCPRVIFCLKITGISILEFSAFWGVLILCYVCTRDMYLFMYVRTYVYM